MNSTKFVFCEMPESSQGELVYLRVKLYINENDKCDALLREGLATTINPEKEQKTLKLVITSAVFSGIGDEHRLVVLGARPATKDDVNIEITSSTPCTPKKRSREADGADADAAEASFGNAAIPISDLGKAPGKLVFNGKVVEKTDVIAFKSGNGEFFKIKVQDVDDEKASIWCIAFTDVCRQLHVLLDIGGLYRFEGGRVKAARPPPDGGEGGEGKDVKEIVFTTETKIVSIAV